MWLYSLKNTVRNKDYNSIYNELQDNITSKIFYNTSVYVLRAWGPKDIYNYIYILVMIIGVASLTYQVIGYQHGRNRFYKRIQLIGAVKKTGTYDAVLWKSHNTGCCRVSWKFYCNVWSESFCVGSLNGIKEFLFKITAGHYFKMHSDYINCNVRSELVRIA